jgi:outer membrane cobalamin receptor
LKLYLKFINTTSSNYLKLLSLFILIICTVSIASAQKASVRGTVIDKETGEGIIYALVKLKNTNFAAQTDANGFFSLAQIPIGNYTLTTTYIGYDTTSVEISLIENDIQTQNLVLQRRRISISNIIINAQKQEKKTETNISITKISTRDINRIPGIGGSPDLAQYLQIIPGVIFTGDQGGELYIRGGTPIQTKMLLDGMTLYNPFHSIGLFSVYETDIIKNVNVLTGAFNAQYGGRLSAVVDVQIRDGNKKHFAGKIAVNPFQSKIILEGPLKKLDETSGSSITYILTGKTSYLDKSSKLFYSNIDTNGLPYNYTDIYGKLSINGGNGSKVSFFGFNYTDNVNFTNVSDFGWKSFGGGSNFVVVPSGANTLISGSLTFSDYEISLQEADGRPRTSGINGFDLITDLTYFFNNAELKYGINIGGYKTKFDFYNSVGNQISQDQNTTELSVFTIYKHTSKKFVIEPSLRIHVYASLPAISMEPRFGIKWNISDNFRFKAATGFYSQNFISAKSDRDVVNLFTGFLTAPDGQLEKLNGEDAQTNLQKSFHVVAGFEYDVNDYIDINIEPYYKVFNQLINLNRNKLFPTDPDFQIETGRAYGIDLLIKYDYKRFYFYAGYSFGFVKRDNGLQVYPPHYDRRHNTNVVGSYTWGKNKSWEFSARWNLGSGFPFTKIQGNFEYLTFDEGINTNYLSDNGELGTVYDAKLNTGRLPYYHRLDLSLKKVFTLSERSKLEIVASAINIYNRENIFYFDSIRKTRVNQLPLLPSLGVSLTF